MRTFKKNAVVAGVTVLAVVSGGIAFAYWTNSGSGTGSAATGSDSAITVKQTSVITGLAPNLPAQTLSGNFDNPNPSPVFVAAVLATGLTVDGTHAAEGCSPADYELGGTATVGAEVPAGNGVGSWSGLTVRFKNDTARNQDACKGATVTIAYASN
jgi:hypothetical protein